ncbi:ABC-type multidrug transport system, permease component [Lacticaseibacillus pantheris DSM 15945 = JCM 12539 = NBRC 106106]|jgi:ABC-2 type transport system permease protein|uniref:ABC-type multidrug transport system, permease component n=1 Tax=Lacticaseibacillus pantheris DSM 15945 = JCM 12539 = NBRC 106106 TaxID=1423783 RepID=A0A0R1U403_9LACO|nr:ABC transporter permease [Lacticaseibacillus pantheris]KRL84491.1 ABC-type multidrug transport system, permease component [Lacticaseibacillus pantheris DSM 15945 = JCM 12539 = NBRC 106106]
MKTYANQFAFDIRREVLRNLPFLFFSVLMPAGFYILFTKIMASGTRAEQALLAGNYMGSMVVYSLLISAFFGLAALVQRDRRSGYLERLRQTPVGLRPYYCSIALCFLIMTILSTSIMLGLAVGLNHVSLGIDQVLLIMVVALVGELPLLVIGVLISRIHREETLSVVSNILTFPIAIISGLWWPLTMLPHWLQVIGKLLPTYRLDQLLNDIVVKQPLPGYDWSIVIGWLLIVAALLAVQKVLIGRWQLGVTE